MFRLPGPAARAAAPARSARPPSGAALFAPLLLVRWGAVRRLAGWTIGRLAPAAAGAAVTRHTLPAALGAGDPAARRDALRALGEWALYRPETAMVVEWALARPGACGGARRPDPRAGRGRTAGGAPGPPPPHPAARSRALGRGRSPRPARTRRLSNPRGKR